VGELFTSFEDAWAHFLARDEPLESFWDEYPDDPTAALDVWLVVPPPEVKRASLRVQGVLEEIGGLRIVPHHFLHLTLPDDQIDALAEHGPFAVRCERLNCFPDAVVAEVESEALDELEAPATFLPHVSLAYVELPIRPDPVREALLPLRRTGLGLFEVDELVRARVPAAKSTVLQPWTVVERASLRR
jgi:2'-5' RNA ligase